MVDYSANYGELPEIKKLCVEHKLTALFRWGAGDEYGPGYELIKDGIRDNIVVNGESYCPIIGHDHEFALSLHDINTALKKGCLSELIETCNNYKKLLDEFS